MAIHDITKFTEKYRPTTLDGFFGHEEIKQAIKNQVRDNSQQDIIFYGPAGTGKTTLARIVAHLIHGEHWKGATLDLNASDDNGVDTIRKKVKNSARTQCVGGLPQIIILDEADALTPQAQNALRRIMEDNPSTKFILLTNDLTKMIDPIQSRCEGSTFFLDRLVTGDIVNLITFVSDKAGVEAPPADILASILHRAKGDARRAIDLLESYTHDSLLVESNTDKRLNEFVEDLFGTDYALDVAGKIHVLELPHLTDLLMEHKIDPNGMITTIAETEFRLQRSHHEILQLGWMVVELRKYIKS